MSERRYVYLNYAQQMFYYCCGRDTRCEFPRRTGKTHGFLSPAMHRAQKSMPCGSGVFIGHNRKSIMARTMPAVTLSFKSTWGLEEGKHYVFGKPPAKLNYPEPFLKPKDWSNTFSYANGFVWTLASLAVVGSVNGCTFSVAMGDEAKFWSKEKLDSEIMPTLSGNIPLYGAKDAFSMANPFYKSTCFVSDAALSSKGSWMEREEAKMDMVIESGPNKGRTSRELKEELMAHASRIIDFNEAAYKAKKANRKLIVKDRVTIERIKEIRELVRERKGKFHVLPNGEISEKNCKMLVDYHVLTPEDANLLYNIDYMITQEDYMYAQMVQKAPKFQEHILQLRRDSFQYWRGSTLDNISLLSEDYIRRCKRDLPSVIFQLSILGVKIKRSSDGFYYALDVDSVHGYIDDDDNGVVDDNTFVHKVSHVYCGKSYEAEVESPDFERIAEIDDCRMDGDLKETDELCIAFDANSRINWCIVGKVADDPDNRNISTLWVINSLYVKNEEKIETLVRNFNKYYAPHRRRNNRITFYWDATFKSDKLHYAQETRRPESFAETIIRLLSQAGWNVNSVYIGEPMSHNTKYREINNGLKGIAAPAVRINKEKNEALIVSMENADVRQGYGKDGRSYIMKDKTAEKLAYNPDMDDGGTSGSNVREEWRTDGSDAFDTLYIGTKYFRYGSSEVFSCG